MGGNPNHLVVVQMQTVWPKIVAIIMRQQRLTEVEITEVDTMDIDGKMSIIADMRGGRCIIRLVDNAEAERLAREEGGLAH